MPRIEESIEIAVARVDVFRFCHDLASRPEWDEQVEHMELLTPRPIRQSTLFRIDAKPSGGSVFSWDGEFVSFHLPQESRVRVIDTAVSSPFGAGSQIEWQFSSVGSSTRFTWIWEYQPHGWIASITYRLGGGAAVKRALQRSLENLKKLLEPGRRAGVN